MLPHRGIRGAKSARSKRISDYASRTCGLSKGSENSSRQMHRKGCSASSAVPRRSKLTSRGEDTSDIQRSPRAVLLSFPATQILLPDPQDNSTSPDKGKLEIHRASTLLRSLWSPQRSELQDLVGQLYTSDFRCDDEYLVYAFPENRPIDQDPSTWLGDFVASLCSIAVVARMKYRIQNLGGPERCANTQSPRLR